MLRPMMVNYMLSSEKTNEGVCLHCKQEKAVVMCRDCMPRTLYCTACDLCVHESMVLHNRTAMVEGFRRPLPPNTYITDYEGKFTFNEKGTYKENSTGGLLAQQAKSGMTSLCKIIHLLVIFSVLFEEEKKCTRCGPTSRICDITTAELVSNDVESPPLHKHWELTFQSSRNLID